VLQISPIPVALLERKTLERDENQKKKMVHTSDKEDLPPATNCGGAMQEPLHAPTCVSRNTLRTNANNEFGDDNHNHDISEGMPLLESKKKKLKRRKKKTSSTYFSAPRQHKYESRSLWDCGNDSQYSSR